MQDLIDQYKKYNQLHHFHILIGEKDESRNQLLDFCEKTLGYEVQQNPLFINQDFDRLLIDDVRKIVSHSFVKTDSGKKMIFCISCNDVTRQAQNALLKIVEEPSTETYFFLIAPRKDVFIPTVISRAVLVSIEDGDTDSIVDEAVEDILNKKKTVGDKLKVVEGVVKEIKDKKMEKGVAREIVKRIIIELEKDAANNVDKLKSLQKIDDYLGDSSASTKLLLEKVVLSI